MVAARGLRCGTQVILAWGTRDGPIPPPVADSEEAFGTDPIRPDADLFIKAEIRTERGFTDLLNRALRGLRHDLDHHANVVMMALDPATEGRLSITCYRELKGDEYLERVAHWRRSHAWHHGYKRGDGDKIKKAAIERLQPCIFDGEPVPCDIVGAAARYDGRITRITAFF